jgi:multisubunit Na+/H+ antiporter MnhC subunit
MFVYTLILTAIVFYVAGLGTFFAWCILTDPKMKADRVQARESKKAAKVGPNPFTPDILDY